MENVEGCTVLTHRQRAMRYLCRRLVCMGLLDLVEINYALGLTLDFATLFERYENNGEASLFCPSTR